MMRTFPVSGVEKPTYYFDRHGKEVSYGEHAEFIVANSVAHGDWWCYPMLDFRDKGTHYEVHLVVKYYERKPIKFDKFMDGLK